MLLPQTQTDSMITNAMAGTTPYDPTTGTGTIVK